MGRRVWGGVFQGQEESFMELIIGSKLSRTAGEESVREIRRSKETQTVSEQTPGARGCDEGRRQWAPGKRGVRRI